MISRTASARLDELMEQFPVVSIIGPRQVGKTTLAKSKAGAQTLYIDLESDIGMAQMTNPGLMLRSNKEKLIILDEVQLMPALFPLIRSIIDEDRRAGRMILLSSAAPSLIRKTAESLAGRIAYMELPSLLTSEVDKHEQLWVRGGFPESFLAKSDQRSYEWRNQLLGTYIQRDLPLLGLNANPRLLNNFLRMLAHSNGQLWNASLIAKSLGITSPTVKRYLEYLEGAFLIDVIEPYHTNAKKRITKSPKTYFKDTGLLHKLLNIKSFEELFGHPGFGSSWENFVIQQVKGQLGDRYDFHFYRTHDGTELDLILTQGNRPIATMEIKYLPAPKITKSLKLAVADIGAEQNFIVCSGQERFPVHPQIEVIGLEEVIEVLK